MMQQYRLLFNEIFNLPIGHKLSLLAPTEHLHVRVGHFYVVAVLISEFRHERHLYVIEIVQLCQIQ